ncbi:shikimate dehydrogenase [[Clostridium] polysaccharolyticum]|uniref:Shikimate dehydrogenase (NADP(+)) n=1 Tax=[Clostridium] polysaccharolyticum TaxID=29364 RepID=A0A1H9ZZX0_9FIRM|nr:shikimate dehydrogenase [[Clostridium] polysaccharolyticum]SES86961.1 shikimate dehydrogenase [[Clostridium] polysaccharolyticum]
MKKEITGHTVLTALLGSPVSHSISPQMHNESFRMLGLDYVYLAFDISLDHLKTTIETLKHMQARGCNLTMPHKNLVCEYVDHLSPAAKLSHSVNTVVNDNGILTGHTTDGIGYMKAVEDAGHSIIGKKMTLLGAGGASSSVLVQAALDGVKEIDVFNRRGENFNKAQKLIDRLNQETGCHVSLYDLEDEKQLSDSIQESAILTNGTSVGMHPNEDGCLIKNLDVFRNDLIVSDLIYNPRETKLMRLAKERGSQTFNGLYMLLYQGAAAFELWTGHPMPVDHIKKRYFSE